ncbi:MAG: hypothetical protein V7608_5111 [Hyphomicrobiales bacterium]
MTIKWLGTTAIALVIGSGAVIVQAQPDLPKKREESPRAQAPSLPSKEADRPAAGEYQQQPADRLKNRAAQPEPKAGAKGPQRGEGPAPLERKQAQEPTPPRDTKQLLKQSQERQGQEGQDQQKQTQEMLREEQPGRGERPPAGAAQQRENQPGGREAERPAEPKQQLGRDRQPKQENQARDTKQPAEPKQQQGQRQPARERNDQARERSDQGRKRDDQARERNDQARERGDQAAQPSATAPAQQGARPGDASQNRQQGQGSSQPADQTARRGTSSSLAIDDRQRTQIVERLRHDRTVSNQNINIQVNIGQRLPPRARARPLPPDIVRIAPQYRGYHYTVIEDEVVIVHPRTHEVVDVIREPGSTVKTTSRVGRERVVMTREQRETLKQVARRMTTAPVSGSPSGSAPDSSCLTLQPVPEDLVRANPELGSYRYLAIGDEVVLVDPSEQKIVEVIN